MLRLARWNLRFYPVLKGLTMVYAQPHRIEAHRPTYTVGKFAAITRFVESHQMIAANISGAGSLYIKLVCSIFFL